MRLPLALVEKLDNEGNMVSFDFIEQNSHIPIERLVTRERLAAIDTLAIVRDCGIGDLLMITPTLRYLKNRFPHLVIDFFTIEQNGAVLRHSPHLNAILPIERLDPEKYDSVVDLRGFVERHPKALSLSRPYLFGRAFDLRLTDLSMESYTTVSESNAILDRLNIKENPKPRIGIAPYSKSPLRDWLAAPELIPMINDMGGSVYWFSAGGRPDGVVDHFSADDKVTIWENAIMYMDAMVCCDSGPLHLAQSVQRNHSNFAPYIVALFGVGSPELLMPACENYFAFTPDENTFECHPCMHGPESFGCKGDCMLTFKAKDVFEVLMMGLPEETT